MRAAKQKAKAIRLLAVILPACWALSACSYTKSANVDPAPPPLSSTLNWQPLMSQSEIGTVRQTFLDFIPPRVAPGASTGPAVSYDPSTFAPALFFGMPSAQGAQLTAVGISVETNGYDGLGQPVLLPNQGTYFDPQNVAFQFQLGPLDLVPLNKLESRMHVPFTPNAPVLTVNRSSGRVELSDVDRILTAVQSSLALRLPQVASVDIRKCQVTIEPTLMFFQQSNFGGGWAGGSTEDLGNGNYKLHLAVFFIGGAQRVVVNWQMYLVDEGINFFVLSIGRPDLAQ